MSSARTGSTVKIHYTGKLDDGTVFDSSIGGEPLNFTIGSSQVIPGFENGVIGMKVNDVKTIRLEPADAYGDRNEELLFTVSRDEVPGDIQPAEGQRFQISNDDGNSFVATIVEVGAGDVTFDANHPLAGMALTFELELLEIQA